MKLTGQMKDLLMSLMVSKKLEQENYVKESGAGKAT